MKVETEENETLTPTDKKEWVWLQSGSEFTLGNLSTAIDELPIGVYNVCYSMISGFFLTREADSFELPKKLYGFEDFFIDRVIKTFYHTEGNLGILLNGIKGSGKTITGKVLSNKLEKPILLVSQKFEKGLNEFLNDINQDIIVFIDEYEKIFEDKSNLLSLMDGTIQSKHRKVFILTTNDLKINTNLIDRPSRIRYLKTFNTLSEPVIKSILDDLLINKDLMNNALALLKTISNLTVDICLSIIQEINIHNVVDEDFCTFFNAEEMQEYVYDVEMKSPDEKEYSDCRLEISEGNLPTSFKQSFAKRHIGNELFFGWAEDFEDFEDYRFRITKIINPHTIECDIIVDSDRGGRQSTGQSLIIKITKYMKYNSTFNNIRDDFAYVL